MSDREASVTISKENTQPGLNLEISSLTINHPETMEEIKGHRVTLQTLQPSAKVKGFVGPKGQVMSSTKDGKARRKVQSGKISVFEDKCPQPVKSETKKLVVEEKGIQTENNDISSMISDDVTVEYWSVLAERRRLALAEALEENMGLHEEVESLKNQVDTLKTENALLKPLAEEAKYLAGVLKDLVGDAEDEEEGVQPNKEESDAQETDN